MDHESGPVTRHRRARSSGTDVEATAAPKRPRLANGIEELEPMALELQNGHAHSPAPPSRLGAKQLIDRCCAS